MYKIRIPFIQISWICIYIVL